MPIPAGTKDILPPEAGELRFLKDSIGSVFSSFGYREVITPTLELETVLETSGERRFRKSFRLFDEHGDVMMLRPDMTAPIARLVASRMTDIEPPFRLCYFANCFRPTRPQRGRQSEFYQAGLELIGADTPAMDAEVLAVICQALGACRVGSYSIVLGEVSFFKALLDSAGIGGEERESIFSALAARDMVELAHIVNGMQIPAADKQSILDVVSLRGGSEVLVAAQDMVRGPEMESALKRLARTFYLVSRYGFGSRILFDLGIMRNFDYYTGIVFEILSGELGFPIGGGGRYDGLLEKFGRPAPAVGFAIGLDRLHIAVTEQGGAELCESYGVALAGGQDQQLGLAMELREKGISVLALPEDMPAEEARRLAAESGFAYVLLPEGDNYRLGEVAGGDFVTLARDEIATRIGV